MRLASDLKSVIKVSEIVKMVQDVYTRELRAKALPNKDQATVKQAARQVIPELVNRLQSEHQN